MTQLSRMCACTGACRVPPYQCGVSITPSTKAIYDDLIRKMQATAIPARPPQRRSTLVEVNPGARLVGWRLDGRPRYRVKAGSSR